MLYLQDSRVTVWKADKKGKYYEIQMSSARKDKKSGDYINSSWGFVRFVGDAAKKAEELERGDRIVLKGAAFSREPYMDGDEKKWPKNPSLVVFNFEWVEKPNEEVKEESSDDDDDLDPENLPF